MLANPSRGLNSSHTLVEHLQSKTSVQLAYQQYFSFLSKRCFQPNALHSELLYHQLFVITLKLKRKEIGRKNCVSHSREIEETVDAVRGVKWHLWESRQRLLPFLSTFSKLKQKHDRTCWHATIDAAWETCDPSDTHSPNESQPKQ